MNWDRHTLWNAGWPALSAGAAGVVLSAIVSPGLLIPACVAVSAMAGSVLTAAWVHRGQQEAKARLRHPELSSTHNPGGIFGEVTQAAVVLLRQYESELQRLTTAKGELEISGKLQKKQARRLDQGRMSMPRQNDRDPCQWRHRQQVLRRFTRGREDIAANGGVRD